MSPVNIAERLDGHQTKPQKKRIKTAANEVLESLFSGQINLLHHIVRIHATTHFGVQPEIHNLPNPWSMDRKYVGKQIRFASPKPLF